MFAILKTNLENSETRWVDACKSLNVNYEIIDITAYDWLDKINMSRADYFLAQPMYVLSHYKQLFDERLYIIANILKKPVFPSYNEVILHENKRMLAYWLKANNIPHPTTTIIYNKNEALNFIKNTKYPIVAKTAIGAAAAGVEILKSFKQASKYIKKAFSSKGIPKRFGPNTRNIDFPQRAKKNALNFKKIISKLKNYILIHSDKQKGFVIFQEYIKHDYEWRIVRIGDSFFAYKKLVFNDKASGAKRFEYGPPPVQLMNFIKNLTDKYQFFNVAIDVFPKDDNTFLINEIQTKFSHRNPYILKIDDKPGRYIYSNDQWVFEEGNFNENESYNLRLKYLIDKINSSL